MFMFTDVPKSKDAIRKRPNIADLCIENLPKY
jgi:hypothetical protein